MPSFAGVYPPIATPFDAQGGLDCAALEHNLALWEATGLHGYCVGGSNGESVLLTEEELLTAVRVVRAGVPSSKRVIVGTGCESTLATIRLSQAAADVGADAALVITPSFYAGEMGPAALIRHYEAVAEASPIPVLIYNVPKFTNLNLSAATVAKLAPHPNIAGIKDSAGNIAQLIDLVRLCPQGFEILVGNGPAFLSGLQVGAVGGVLAVANVAPRECVQVWALARAGRWAEALEVHLRTIPIGHAVTAGYGVPGLKAALELQGYRVGQPRLPLLPADEATRTVLANILRAAGLI